MRGSPSPLAHTRTPQPSAVHLLEVFERYLSVDRDGAVGYVTMLQVLLLAHRHCDESGRPRKTRICSAPKTRLAKPPFSWHPRAEPKSRDIPPKKFDFPGFEGHTELFGPHPFVWKTPHPARKYPDSLCGPNWGLFFVLKFVRSRGFGARFLQSFPKSLVTVKYYS